VKSWSEGAIRFVSINRPAALNALGHGVGTRMASELSEFESDEHQRVAVITGEGGRAFSVGGDLKEMAAAALRQTPEERRGFPIPRLGSMHPHDDIANCSKPVIAAIDGYCLAGGFEIALMCDIRVATTQSSFGLPEPRRGLIAGPGLHSLSRMIPLGEALHMQLTGSRIEADRAYQIGLVQALAPDRDELFRVVRQICAEMTECSPSALRAIKKIVRRGREMPLEHSWLLAEPFQESLSRSPEGIDGPIAFAEKRDAVWVDPASEGSSQS
jgi:enoyl-CoA hydratase/carnithine racemase